MKNIRKNSVLPAIALFAVGVFICGACIGGGKFVFAFVGLCFVAFLFLLLVA